MTPSTVGAVLLSVVGVIFLAAALRAWLRRDLVSHENTRRRLGITVDLMVGVVAIGDAATGVIRESERALIWMIGTLVLLGAVALLVCRHGRDRNHGSFER